MKNNILNRFAFNDLKIHKKDSMSLLIMIFISSLIIFTISFISQTYNKEKYDDHQPLAYYEGGKHAYMIHPETRALLEYLLHMLDEQGEDVTFAYIRKNLVGKKEYPDISK